MKLIYNPVFLEHDTGEHPESRRRLEALGALPETEIYNGEQYLGLIHSKEHIEFVKETCKSSKPLDADTLTSPGSYNAAIHAVAAVILASQQQDFALVRPPGHHAYSDYSSGFCLFNNIAIACQKLVNEGKRIAIIDFDGHYGDGTSSIFYETNKVLYCSLHQYPAYPGKGFVNEIGKENGTGYTINVPLPPGSGDDIFMDALERIMLPIAQQFRPDIVAVSAGFDAYQFDPLLNLKVSATAFYNAGKLLSSKFDAIFATLEGGYNIEGLPKCLYNFINGINGEEILHKEENTFSDSFVLKEYKSRCDMLKRNILNYWKV